MDNKSKITQYLMWTLIPAIAIGVTISLWLFHDLPWHWTFSPLFILVGIYGLGYLILRLVAKIMRDGV